MNRNRLYTFLMIACMAGNAWLFYDMNSGQTSNICMFKGVTGIPCPSCGATRAVESILHGELMHSLTINPLGFVVATIMFIAPIWILVDLVRRRNTLYDSYRRIESFFRKPRVIIPFALLVLVNWIWNINKGL